MENLKDEQIKNQGETIASLERKVESLERELQRHLDPDSGTISPRFQPEKQRSKAAQYAGYKANGGTMTMQEWENDSRYDPSLSGEAGRSDQKWIRDNPFKAVIHNTIAAQFMPVEKYNSFRKEWYKETPHNIWWLFRSAIFEGERSANLLQSQAFRDVIWSMNNFIEDMSRDKAGFDLLTSSADVILENTTAEGWALALEALNCEQGNGRRILEDQDYQWLKLTMLNIHRCVKMHHEAAEPEAEKN